MVSWCNLHVCCCICVDSFSINPCNIDNVYVLENAFFLCLVNYLEIFSNKIKYSILKLFYSCSTVNVFLYRVKQMLLPQKLLKRKRIMFWTCIHLVKKKFWIGDDWYTTFIIYSLMFICWYTAEDSHQSSGMTFQSTVGSDRNRMVSVQKLHPLWYFTEWPCMISGWSFCFVMTTSPLIFCSFKKFLDIMRWCLILLRCQLHLHKIRTLF